VAFVPESASGVCCLNLWCLYGLDCVSAYACFYRCKSQGHYLVCGHDQAMHTRGISLLELST
jgi:hypothetical protein